MKQESHLIFGIITLLVMVLISGCVQQPKESTFKFSSGQCGEIANHYDETNVGIKETVWQEDILKITAYVKINCAETIEKGSYEIIDNKIILKYKAPRCKVCATCKCVSELNYTFENLEKRNYDFELERIF